MVDAPAPAPEQVTTTNYDDYFGKYEDQLKGVDQRLAEKAAEEKAYEEELYKSLHEASEQLEFTRNPYPRKTTRSRGR